MRHCTTPRSLDCYQYEKAIERPVAHITEDHETAAINWTNQTNRAKPTATIAYHSKWLRHKGRTLSKKYGLSTSNIVILSVAALSLAGAITWSVVRDENPAATAVAAANSPHSTLAALEQAVLDSPDQPEPWSALGAAHFDDGNFHGAVEAYQKATNLAPTSGGLWSALGEAIVMASEGDPMPPAAIEAFDKAITLNAKDPRARYFMAVKKDLAGDHQGAINDWFALLADTPTGAPWEADLRRTIEQVGAIHKIDVAARLAATQPRAPTAEEIPLAARAIPGPTRQDMEAASQLPKGQQDTMISGMVASLERKIADNPKNVDQWIMLMRSRMTLGETQKAAKALKDAIAANPEASARLKSQAELLGVPAA